MEKLTNMTIGRQIKAITNPQQVSFALNAQPIFYLIIVLSSFLFTACKKYSADEPRGEELTMRNTATNTDAELLTYYHGLDPQTLWELQQARAATAKYRDIKNAFKDDYVDIGLVMENMGYHFLKAELISPVFDIKRPAILVYNKSEDGSFELVALEYAVPIDPQNSNTPPEGFTGDADEWDFNTLDSGWWTLHAWVWKNNPDGVFNMTNPTVIVR